jgi:hypothetical protein
MLNLTEGQAPTSGGIRILRDVYGIRCIEADFKVSQNANATPYIELTWEIVTPEKIGDKAIAGLKTTNRYFLTAKAIGRLKAFHEMMGLELGEINEQDGEFMKDYVQRYKGLGAKAILSSEERRQQKEVIDAAGDVVKEDMLDESGNPIVSFGIRVDNITKKAPELTIEVTH